MEEKDQLVLSLPPFDHFGLDSLIKKNKIKYISLSEATTSLIRSAGNTIYISSPFLEINTIPKIKEELLKKAKSTRIKILVREVNKGDKVRKENILSFLEEARKIGVIENLEIRDYHYTNNPGIMSSVHAKFIIIDGRRMYIGSGELRKNSTEKNFEAGIITSGKMVEDLEKIFLDLFSKSRLVK